ncbi:hypothetical protein LLH23_20770 [bacterium]|nr:hypothetical protein [bacterium]
MKSRLVVAVLVCVVLASGVWAQQIASVSTRAIGMGGAGIAVADDAAAWFQNPAGLATLGVPVKEGNEYGNDLYFAYASAGDFDGWGLSWSGWKPSERLGFGAGYASADDLADVFGAGFGAGLKDIPLSAGINVASVDPDGGDEHTILNLGLLYKLDLGEGKDPLRLGLTVVDLADEFEVGPFWNAGLAWKPVADLLIAVDVCDLTEEMGDATISGGAEYSFGEAKEWKLRAGLLDTSTVAGLMGGDDEHKFTAGVGYQAKNWRADFGYLDIEPDALWTLGVGVNL